MIELFADPEAPTLRWADDAPEDRGNLYTMPSHDFREFLFTVIPGLAIVFAIIVVFAYGFVYEIVHAAEAGLK